jgi:hypothetical protein
VAVTIHTVIFPSSKRVPTLQRKMLPLCSVLTRTDHLLDCCAIGFHFSRLFQNGQSWSRKSPVTLRSGSALPRLSHPGSILIRFSLSADLISLFVPQTANQLNISSLRLRCLSLLKQSVLATCSHTGFLLSLFFDPEDGGDMFLRNVG